MRLCADSAGEDFFAAACATVLQQSHLCPLPLESQPVFWQVRPCREDACGVQRAA